MLIASCFLVAILDLSVKTLPRVVNCDVMSSFHQSHLSLGPGSFGWNCSAVNGGTWGARLDSVAMVPKKIYTRQKSLKVPLLFGNVHGFNSSILMKRS